MKMKKYRNKNNNKKNPGNQTPCHSSLSSGIICGPHRRSFAVRDYLRPNLGIISGLGSFAVGDHLRGSFGKLSVLWCQRVFKKVLKLCECGSILFMVEFGIVFDFHTMHAHQNKEKYQIVLRACKTEPQHGHRSMIHPKVFYTVITLLAWSALQINLEDKIAFKVFFLVFL